MALDNIKGFYVTDEDSGESGVAKLGTDAYADSSVTTAKVANKAIARQKLSDDVQAELNVANPASWMVKDDDYVNALYSEDDDVNYPIAASAAIDGLAETLDHKADQDGDYDDLTAGGAKQLLSTVYVDDNEPYIFRTAGGSADIGDRMYEEVVGGSIVWNQHTAKTSNATTQGVTCTRITDTEFSLNGTAANIAYIVLSSNDEDKSIIGHKYMAVCYVPNTYSADQVRVYNDNGNVSTTIGGGHDVYIGGAYYGFGSATKNNGWYVRISADVTFDNVKVGWQVFDLTQMFGSTIADYIYSLEQGTAGAGVAWFRKLFPKPYYAYNAGELMSVKAGSHDTVGFNALDLASAVEQFSSITKVSDGVYRATAGTWNGATKIDGWEKIKYVKGQSYCASAYISITGGVTNARVQFVYTDGTTTPGSSRNTDGYSMAVSDSSKEIRYCQVTYGSGGDGTLTLSEFSIHLAWDGERNGEYEPYEKHTYPLSNIELRGIPKLDANNQLYYDGDTYASDGTVTRKYGIVDLASLTWQTRGTGTTKVGYSASTPLPYKAVPTSMSYSTKAPFVCDKYSVLGHTSGQSIQNEGPENLDIGIYGYQSNTPTNTFYAVLPVGTTPSGYLVYELAEPTTETADAFTNPQIINDFGTEEYVDYAYEAGDRDVAIPVGHDSKYMNNLRAKLEMAPDSPGGDGDYIVRQSNGENSYVPYTADGRLTALEAKLPAPPSTNGTYKLTATVTDGGVTYTWTAG